MVSLRSPHPEDTLNGGPTPSRGPSGAGPQPAGSPHPGCRLNMLLSTAAWASHDPWDQCLPRLLEPMGVRTYRVHSGKEAAALIQTTPVHLAVVDMAMPLDAAPARNASMTTAPAPSSAATNEEGGRRLLELLSRLSSPPPTVVIRRVRTRREDARELASALSAGVFAVLDRPVNLETLLEVMRRVLQRHYSNRWPVSGASGTFGASVPPRCS